MRIITLMFLACFIFLGCSRPHPQYTHISYQDGTLTPQPSLEDENEHIFETEECKLPCLIDLTVGVDTLEDIIAWVEGFPQKLAYKISERDDKYTILYTVFDAYNPLAGTTDYVGLDFFIDKEKDILSAIQIYIETAESQYWDDYMPDRFVSQYGEPAKPKLEIIISPFSYLPFFAFSMIYPDKGMYIRYAGILRQEKELFNSAFQEIVCIAEATHGMLIWFQPTDTPELLIQNPFVVWDISVGNEEVKIIEIDLDTEDLQTLYREDSCLVVKY
jgi:hypothetical protein